jgi:hypothetical protein
MKNLSNTISENKNLTKLQSLCDTVNRRYASGLNDDDQVNRMFTFEDKIKDARVIIGYDTYKAISIENLNELKKEAEMLTYKNGKQYFEFILTKNGMYLGRYKCNLPIIKN